MTASKMAMDLMDKVLHYGAFKEALDKVVDIMRSEYAGSIIIRGNAGSGKKTLIQEARRITGVRCVVLGSQNYSEDHTAMRAIVTALGSKSRALHISELMDEVRQSAKGEEKLVIVLLDFEEFCRKRQSLLYNLMNLIHTNPNQDDRGLNLSLIGLTASLDWAENIEKRVRSRLNAKCIDLPLPYQSSDEFLEFASELMDGRVINCDLQEHLEYIYHFSSRSIPTLKKFLFNICLTNSRGKLKIDFDPKRWNDDYQMVSNNLKRERLRYLTRPQLDLLKLAVSYCATHGASFTLADLQRYALDKNYKNLDATSNHAMRDATLLLKVKLFKPAKSEQAVSEEAVFYPAVTARQLRAIVEGDTSLQHTMTDLLWKNLKLRA